MRLSITRQAKGDLDGIWQHIATESGSTEAAERVIESVGKTLNNLRLAPHAGRSRDGDLGPGLRSFPAGNYVIFYLIKPDKVRILRVLHGRRDAKAIFSNL